MRELAKSMISWAWAMSVFGALQSVRLLAPNSVPNGDAAAGAFDSVTDAATGLLSAPAKRAWKAGVAAQDAVLDALAKTTPASDTDVLKHEEPARLSSSEPMPIESLGTRREPHP